MAPSASLAQGARRQDKHAKHRHPEQQFGPQHQRRVCEVPELLDERPRSCP